MKTVTVTRGLRGHDGRYYRVGETVSLPDGKADFVVQHGIAVLAAGEPELPVTGVPEILKPGGRKSAKSS